MAYNATEYNQKYYAENREREKARGRADYLKHRDKRIASMKVWHQNNKAKVRKLQRDAHTRRRSLIDAIKNVPCADCGVKYNPWVMQFDHRNPAEKQFVIGVKISRALKTVMAEIAKCDVVCANCHAERTHKLPSNQRYEDKI